MSLPAEEGASTVTAAVTDTDGDSTTITSTASVADGALSSAGNFMGLQATAGVLFSGNLGSYTDTGPATDVTSLIN